MAKKTAKKRADILLFERGLAESRERAQALIMEGLVFHPGGRVLKPGTAMGVDTTLEVRGGHRYVSRGGLKLEHALDEFGLEVEGLTALDVGASTGGFTDCLLQRGARKVYALGPRTLPRQTLGDRHELQQGNNCRNRRQCDHRDAVCCNTRLRT